MLNYYLINLLLMILIYLTKNKVKRKNLNIYFLLIFITLITQNILIHKNLSYLLSINYVLSILFNYLFFISLNKNRFF